MKQGKLKNLIFIDDSGDPGVKFDKGSSAYFSLCAVKFTNTLEAENCAISMKNWKRKMNLRDDFEIKFNKLNRKNRHSILKMLEKHSFEIYCITHKKTIYDAISYSEYINKLFKTYEGVFTESKIFIDGTAETKNLNLFKNKITANTKISTINIKVLDSRDNILIQMADIFVGSLNNKLKNNKEILKSFKINETKI